MLINYPRLIKVIELSYQQNFNSVSMSAVFLFCQVFILVYVCYISHQAQPSEMYIGHGRLCVSLSGAAFLHYGTHVDVTLGSGRECPLVVHCWVVLQWVHGVLLLWQHMCLMRNVVEHACTGFVQSCCMDGIVCIVQVIFLHGLGDTG